MEIRPARHEDALSVASVHVRSWQTAYRGLLPQDYLDQLRPQERAARYDFTHSNPSKPRTLVAVDGAAVCGFATTAPVHGSDLAGYGELCALYVDPGFWGRGIGYALIRAARAHLAARGFENAALWVLRGNVRAERFYHADGWNPDGVSRNHTVWSLSVTEHRYVLNLTTD